jgi:membrane protease YdiL (CAAX protease family)
MVRLCLAEPVLWLIVFGSAVPSIAALLVVVGNRSALGSLLARLGPRVPWRLALIDYGLVFVLMVGGLVAISMLRSFLPGPEYVRPENFVGPGLIVAVLAAAFLDQGAVLEELGWRGFALPELQASRLSPLVAAIVLGIGWGLWHVPRDLTGGVVVRLGVVQYLLLYLPSFLAGTVAVSIIAAYFVNRASGSVIPAIIVHGLSNDSVGISGAASMELALSPYHQATKAFPFALLAVGIILVAGKSLGLSRRRDA